MLWVVFPLLWVALPLLWVPLLWFPGCHSLHGALTLG